MLKVVAEKRCRLESLWKSEKSLFHFVRIQKCANFASHNAAVAQLVEHQLPKLRVAGSSPVCRSVKNLRQSMLESAGVLFYVSGCSVSCVTADGRRCRCRVLRSPHVARNCSVLFCGTVNNHYLCAVRIGSL